MKQTIEERACKAVPDMLRINDNYVASFISGYCRGATEQKRIVIDERKKLEQTPITREWLKAHGFIQNIYRSFEYDLVMDDGRTEIHYYRSGGEPDSTMSIRKGIDLENEACYELPQPYTAAQMLDACKLCGIELK